MTTSSPLVVLAGNPNAGKSALFNMLTGARQKIANYPGVTVERKSGHFALPDGRPAEVLDLPGSYGLNATSPDEAVTRDVLIGNYDAERRADAIILVLDAANLDNHLRFAIEVIALGRPVVIALNMMDLAARDGLTLNPMALQEALGVPVVPTVAVRRKGLNELSEALAGQLKNAAISEPNTGLPVEEKAIFKEARRLAKLTVESETAARRWSERADLLLLHPIFGPLVLLGLLFVMFQAVYSWSAAPMDAIEAGAGLLSSFVENNMADGFIRSLIVEGLIAGVGSVIVFLPQILILFLFILLLEASGYMTRAAFIMDRLMAGVGLSGRSFIPLLSSAACAIPGIMATRSIADPKDRLTTILVSPLITCSARWPVYTMIIGAFVPAQTVGLGVGLQGLVLFLLFIFGTIAALAVAYVFRRTIAKGPNGGFLMEMPKYQIPLMRDIVLGLWQRAWIFLRRAGTIIFAATVILWLAATYPKAPENSGINQIDYSAAGRVAGAIEPVVAPIGFNRDIALALIPAMAAREVAVAALATTYAIEAADEQQESLLLGERLQSRWSLATALAFLAWFVFAPQCISTIAVTRRETNSWRWPLFMLGYLFVLAYAAAGITYWTATAIGL